MNRLIDLSRRQFLKAGAFAAGALATTWSFAQTAVARVLNAIEIRYNSIYQRDRVMPLRKSQDNPEVQTLYRDHLGEPLSPTSESLLHTAYTNRSAKINALKAQGINITLKTSITQL